MQIKSIQIPKIMKNLAVVTPLLLATQTIKPQKIEGLQQDVFVRTEAVKDELKVADSMLMSPELIVAGEAIYPAVVVDLSEGRLYHYDFDTCLNDVYPIASGKKSTPTKPALKVINSIEKYPYTEAPKTTKRFRNPDDYGTYLLNLSKIDPETGLVVGNDGQFIHGTFEPESIGKRVSKGCIRVHNDVIETLANSLKSGQYVLIRE